jgi:23S rRNA (adenine2030-N6)-methyltransferase
MLSYLHSFHAGNFADVHKHVLLTAVLMHLRQKPAPVCYLNTHAGRGLYPLDARETASKGEFRHGIARLWRQSEVPKPVADYLTAVRAYNPDGELRVYPGSPAIARHLLRPQDRLILLELHPRECAHLRQQMRHPQVHCHRRDAFEGLLALVPPPEARGLVLIDPSYEVTAEYRQVPEYVARAQRRWAQACYLIWYALLPGAPQRRLIDGFRRAGLRGVWQSELRVRQGAGLMGSGVIIVDPPWTLPAQWTEVAQALVRWLGQDASAAERSGWLVHE